MATIPTQLPPAVATLAPGIRSPAAGANTAQLGKAAQDFEAMAIAQLLQPMFDTVDSAHGAFGGGPGEGAWKPMLVQELAKQLAAKGGLGLAKPVYEQMLRMKEAGQP